MSMRKVLLALILSTAFGAAAQADSIQSIERPFEMRTDCLIMPSSANGSLACADRSFPLTAETEYWVGNRALTFTEFGKFIQSLAGRPRNGTVFLTVDRRKVTRVYVAGDAPAAAKK